MEVDVDLGRAAAGLRGERQEGSGEDKEAACVDQRTQQRGSWRKVPVRGERLLFCF